MEDKSTISYWITTTKGEDDQILVVPTVSVPVVGETMHFDTRMDKDWYKAKFPKDTKFQFFRKGVYGHFEVVSVKRWYSKFDYVHPELGFPCQRTVENFEVHLKDVERYYV